jgi:hypothetical protein
MVSFVVGFAIAWSRDGKHVSSATKNHRFRELAEPSLRVCLASKCLVSIHTPIARGMVTLRDTTEIEISICPTAADAP